ncbi:hypothetical protein BZL30_9457 [Mycobacterium kansasii]|uniref:Uncharacterized protein n=1 Tax=Mycobacterium kansasii TaxID=1768 RepID=A0A1V3W967_MYCKA|nr:hypothetical protein BZL30_9457 [Mycobacterium kansasii]
MRRRAVTFTADAAYHRPATTTDYRSERCPARAMRAAIRSLLVVISITVTVFAGRTGVR